MASRERPIGRGTTRGRRCIVEVAHEIRAARLDRAPSLSAVGRATGQSHSTVSRIERGLATHVTLLQLSRLTAVVGLELSVRCFPGGQPIRDFAQAALLARFRGRLHRSIRWAAEVPLPRPGDQRAWDALVTGGGWRFGVEAETAGRPDGPRRGTRARRQPGPPGGRYDRCLPTFRPSPGILAAAPPLRYSR